MNQQINNGQFGVAIRRLRLEKGMSQAKLADKCGYPSHSHVMISYLECGHAMVTCAHLVRIADAMNVSIGTIINEAARVRDTYTKSSTEFIKRAVAVKQRRTKLDLTQKELSNLCHVSRNSVSNLESHDGISPLTVVSPFMWEVLTTIEKALSEYQSPQKSSFNLDGHAVTLTTSTTINSCHASVHLLDGGHVELEVIGDDLGCYHIEWLDDVTSVPPSFTADHGIEILKRGTALLLRKKQVSVGRQIAKTRKSSKKKVTRVETPALPAADSCVYTVHMQVIGDLCHAFVTLGNGEQAKFEIGPGDARDSYRMRPIGKRPTSQEFTFEQCVDIFNRATALLQQRKLEGVK